MSWAFTRPNAPPGFALPEFFGRPEGSAERERSRHSTDPGRGRRAENSRAIDERALRTLFLEARTANGFLAAPVPRPLIERAIDIAELGPTSANTLPVRYVVVTTPEGKEKLKPGVGPAISRRP
jgi:hypothetical protein